MAFMGIPVALGLGKRDRKPVVYDARDIYLNARNLARMVGRRAGSLAVWSAAGPSDRRVSSRSTRRTPT
jgi:hypothetical protein